jgi:hypothetical protein
MGRTRTVQASGGTARATLRADSGLGPADRPDLAPAPTRQFSQLIGALLERENLALTDLARALLRPTQSLHGRLKRVGRFLDNPQLDETALLVRRLKLTYRNILTPGGH